MPREQLRTFVWAFALVLAYKKVYWFWLLKRTHEPCLLWGSVLMSRNVAFFLFGGEGCIPRAKP